MVDYTVTDALTLSTRFNAAFPKDALKKAEGFVNVLESEIAKGAKPPESLLKDGKAALADADKQLSAYAHTLAMNIGMTATSESDIDSQVAIVARGVERAEQTTQRLREQLRALA